MTLIQQPLCRTPRLLLRHQKRGSSQLVQCWLRSYSSGRIGGGGSDGDGMKIYNSLSSSNRTLPTHHHPPRACTTSPSKNNDKRKEQPRRGTAWYVCGPTVYDSAHLGHGRTYVSLDILRRVALHNYSQNNNPQRPRPMYVMNITDVDDKIIKRSMENINSNSSRDNDGNGTKSEKGKEADPLSLARHYEREFWQDMDALNVMRPDVVCRVSEHVEMTIVPYIQQIVDGGMAYVIPEEQQCTDGIESKRDESGTTQQQTQGSVYFDVRAFEAITNGRTKYGKLAPDAASSDFFSWDESNNNNNNADDEGEPLRTKRDPRDFCLWKYRSRSTKTTKPTTVIVEPSSVSYSSPWGPGRPGWHVECSAMIQRLADDFRSTHEFDVHCGGVDLKFPHHSNEIAQAEAHSVACDIGSSSGNNSDDGNDSNGSSTGREEWISHWIHTGHLYVKGRKMSKSLKNFVTIREMLGVAPKTHSVRTASIDDAIASSAIDQDNNAWSSPSDDFRLWVLGLSGSYRGPSTFSKDRMEEARVIREKWVRFLMEGQECLDRWNTTILDDDMYDGGGDRSSRLWGDEEIELFRTVTQCSMNCERALLDDLDGTSFVKELNCIAEAGQTYVQWATANQNKKQRTVNPPEEPLRFVLDTFRGQLNLVGFTQRTANVGISARLSSSSLDQQELGTSLAPSTNTAILDEAVAFRKAVRTAALGAVRKKMDSSDAVKDILKLCDEMRDGTFPKLGVEILDGKVAVETAKDAEGNTSRGWRHCSPRGRA